ncbi:hypothetical protein ciss_16180 [Carboxydothermus islandicus]|uniref:FAD-binding PCMH-type domain-containing protein n=1 Tax=Carboxydothermus islandicus TaxID=661089 RepID=A0A1L8D3C0_9THEO|nr:FAD binding domain-containing protein [Carboxydothermus islandicus]GAV25685.1 hypothetical protein ciss_16180 [Carboxydothermus islandicus]
MLTPFEYVKARTLDEAVMLLSGDDRVKVMAGGTDLIVRIKDRLLEPKRVVDIKGIDGISGITAREDGVYIGAATTMNEIVRNKVIIEKFRVLGEGAHALGSYQIRNRATIGGNVCNASPLADTAPALLVYEAVMIAYGPEGFREIPATEFFVGPGKTVLKSNEILYQIKLPYYQGKAGGSYIKFARTKAVDLAIVGVAALVFDNDDVRIALGAVAPTPIRARKAEQFLRGKKFDQTIREAARIAREECSPIDDIRASKEYRLDLVETLTYRAVKQALANL